MPINPNLLVAAPMLQDYFVDKDSGIPLSGGIISLYVDTARSFYKNWYYQTGSPGAYTYIPLDNPLILSAAGTIQDPNGNDVIPFYYPFDENNEDQPQAYYITVYNSAAILQFTRENFPFEPSSGVSPDIAIPTLRNYILNNVYWRNIGTIDVSDVTSQVIAPSQHEGYTNGDITFVKNIIGATDIIEFLPMTTTLMDDITPETYLNFTCSNAQAGETLKAIQYPISLHVNTLLSVPGTIKFHAQNVSGNANNFVNLYFYQFLGTGAISQPDPILIKQFVLNNNFGLYTASFITPPDPLTQGYTLGLGGDDALFLLIAFPPGITSEINHTKPQIYFSNEIPDNDFDTYDQIESIINSPRTGDVRTSLNSFQPFGYVPANDGSIGSAASSATTRANVDTWPLYNLLWNSVINTFAPVSTGRGSNSYADFTANKTLTLTKVLGRILMGLPLSSTFTYDHTTSLLTVVDTTLYYTGSPVTLSNSGGALPPAFTAGTVYYVIPISSTTFKLASSYANALAGTPVSAGASNGTGTQTVAFSLGGSFGESTHQLLEAQLPGTNLTGQVSGTPGNFGGAGVSVGLGPPVGSGGTLTNTTIKFTNGGSTFNVINPSTYLNVFIKL